MTDDLVRRLRDAAQALTDRDWKLISGADLYGLDELLAEAADALEAAERQQAAQEET